MTDTDTADPIAIDGVMLRDAWYYALPGAALQRGKTVHRALLGEPVLLGRDADGAAFALADTCPHRGTLLSRGAFDGREVECPYHGWRFAPDGRCTAIPSQTADQRPQPADIRARTYAVREAQGNVWIFMPRSGARTAPPPVPEVPAIGDRFQMHVSMVFDCNIDLAVVGLMDPAHGPFVHHSALWRTRKDIYEKAKSFSPLEGALGWRMDRHVASRNSRAYRLLLGGNPETEITYRLPSVRIEHARTPKYDYCGLTACTPLDDSRSEVHHVMYWNVPLASALKPLIRRVTRRFLDQDRRAVMAMVEGLSFNPSTMLIKDADTQTRWYYRLKREWLAAEAENRPPRNSLAPATLRWRS